MNMLWAQDPGSWNLDAFFARASLVLPGSWPRPRRGPNLQEVPLMLLCGGSSHERGVGARESNGGGTRVSGFKSAKTWGYLGDRQLFRGPRPWSLKVCTPTSTRGTEGARPAPAFLSWALQSSHPSASLTHSTPGQALQHPHPNHSHTSDGHPSCTGTPTRRQRHALLEPHRRERWSPGWGRWAGPGGGGALGPCSEARLYASHFLSLPTPDSAHWQPAGLGSAGRQGSNSADSQVSQPGLRFSSTALLTV